MTNANAVYNNVFKKRLEVERPAAIEKHDYINKYMFDNAICGYDSRLMFECIFDAFVKSSNID